MPVISAATVRAQLTGAVSGDDTLIGTLVDRADAALAEWMRFPLPDAGTRTLGAATYTLYPGLMGIDPSDPLVMLLPVRPVISVTSVYIDPERSYGAATAVASGDRDLDTVLGAIVLRDSAGTGWSTALRANKVTVSAGWATLPGSLAQALVMQVGHWLAHTRTAGRLTIDDGQSRVDLTALDLLPEVRSLAQPHRLVAP
jgi:hypothetical protein